LVCLLSETQEIRANNRRYQEIPLEKRNHRSHDKFNSPKLIGKPAAQEEPIERRKSKRNESPALSDYLGPGNPPFKPSCRALSQGFFPPPVPERKAAAVVVVLKKEGKERSPLMEPLLSHLLLN